MEETPGDVNYRGRQPENIYRSSSLMETAISVFNIILAIIFLLAAFAVYEHWLYQREHKNLVHMWNLSLSDEKILNKFVYDLSEAYQNKDDRRLLIAKADESEYRFKIHLRKLKKIAILPRHPELQKIKANIVEYDQNSLALIKLKKRLLSEIKSNKKDEKTLAEIKQLNLRIIPLERRTSEQLWNVSTKNYNPVDGFFNYLQIAAGIKF